MQFVIQKLVQFIIHKEWTKIENIILIIFLLLKAKDISHIFQCNLLTLYLKNYAEKREIKKMIYDQLRRKGDFRYEGSCRVTLLNLQETHTCHYQYDCK